MRIAKLSIVAAIVAGLFVGMAANAQDAKDTKKDGKGKGPNIQQRVDTLTKELNLTAEQKPKVTALLEDQAKKMRELRSEGASQEDRRAKVRSMQEDYRKKMKEILTADQFTKWEKMTAEMRKKGGQGGPSAKKDKEQ